MKIKILYSHLNVTGTDYKVRPQWFDFEKCFQNLLLTSQNMEIHVIFDITRGDLKQNWISKYKTQCIIHEIQGGSMDKAAVEMYKIAKELSNDMDDNDLFYFLENDYLHVDDWDKKVINLFETFQGLNYISLYDHNDKYFLPMYNDLVSKIFVTDTCHWRTVPSTCGSYIINKSIYLEDYETHISLMGDHNKWLALTESKNRFIITPLPGLSTHCMEGLMSPTINWEKINDKN
jgi:hypothetical protein